MSGYFKFFPGVVYTFGKNTEDPQVVTNILARSTFLKEIVDNTAIYYTYQVKESDTPEIIADKLYGDSQRHWMVLLFNKINDPFYEFPMKQDVLDAYIQSKYSQTLNQAKTTIHHYEMRITRTVLLSSTIQSQTLDVYTVNDKEVDFSTGSISTRTVPGTADTDITVGTETVALPSGLTSVTTTVIRAVSNYTYEVDKNESRRTIKLLDAQYVPQVEQEFRLLMQNV